MSISITKQLSAWQDVAVTLPDDNGAGARVTLSAKLIMPTKTELESLAKIQNAGYAAATAQASENTVSQADDWIIAHTQNWRGVTGDNGEEVEYSADNLRLAMTNLPPIRFALLSHLQDMGLGKLALRPKTLSPSTERKQPTATKHQSSDSATQTQ